MNTALFSSGNQPFRKTMHFSLMRIEDIPEIIEIEHAVYPYPWLQLSFTNSVAQQGHDAWIMREECGTLAGYFVSMNAFDEAHLLNIALRPDLQGKGYGRTLLDKAILTANHAGMASMLLEVRPSNTAAKKMYEDYGFLLIGIRRGYYPNDNNTREDALIMRLIL